ncbi:MAG TPA: hypothetical protein VLB84_08570, partial [Bacteroidia bacterium]|nr:hypothetical protein [Bacteroidia bacterium]
MKVKSELESKLHEFSAYILSQSINKRVNLISGSAGEILFLCYYSRYFNDQETLSKIDDRLDNIVNGINSENNSGTFA